MHLLRLASIAFLFGLSTGFLNTAAPQAARLLGLSSSELGFVGAGNPAGYALGCMFCGLLLASIPLKRVLLAGTLSTVGVLLWMANARSAFSLIAANGLFGIVSGAVWPFCSAWMLDLE